jgi:glucose-6-phosphate isomerase
MQYVNFDETAAFRQLADYVSSWKGFDFKTALDAGRVRQCQTKMAAGLTYAWAAKAVDGGALKLLQVLADEQELIAKYKALLNGEMINTGEKRKVLHHLLRGEQGQPVIENGKNIGEFYRKELQRFCDFAEAVRGGKHKGSTGKVFTTVVQIGIGGSDLGPRALYIALDNWAVTAGKKKLDAKFISNVDPDDASAITASAPLEQSLFVLVSKSGTTQETLANELFLKDKLHKAGLDSSKHMIAVTSETSPLARNPAYLDSFYIDDYIGGRYSSSSAVGGCVLSLAFGPDVFKEFLAGAAEADKLALEPDILKNAALLDA